MHPNVNKPKSLAARTVSGPVFLSFYEIIVRFFSFFCQNANETGSNKQDRQDQINTKQDNRFQLVKKKTKQKKQQQQQQQHKLALHQTQSGQPKNVHHMFFLYFTRSYRHTLEYTMKIHCQSPPSIFPS